MLKKGEKEATNKLQLSVKCLEIKPTTLQKSISEHSNAEEFKNIRKQIRGGRPHISSCVLVYY